MINRHVSSPDILEHHGSTHDIFVNKAGDIPEISITVDSLTFPGQATKAVAGLRGINFGL